MNRHGLVTAALAGTLLGSGCGTDELTLSSSASLIGKCSFGEIDYMRIEPGEIFLYAALDTGDGSYAIVTGEASEPEMLTERGAAQELAPAFAATLVGNTFEFGDEKWIGAGNTSGEIHSTGGETYGTQHVYPSCVFWGHAP